METKEQYLLEAKNLSKYFPVKNFFGKLVQEVRAVDRVNLSIKKGETFGLVGESGCGKSTLGRTLIRMYEPTDGILTYDGHDITKTKGKELLAYHKRMQIIFQDPYSALDPHQNVREIMAEPIAVFEKLSEKEMDERIVSLLEKVGMKADDMEKYAYEFSGGQRQRIGIARALSVNPEFLLCDEPISALDVSIRAQVLNLLKKFQREKQVTYLFIAHDLSIVRFISDRIGVIYKGNIVEVADAEELFNFPLHPYTHSLISAIPIPDPQLEKNKVLYTYDPSIHDYSVDKPEFVDIGHNHFVYGNKKEIEEYKALREKGEPLQPITIRKPGEEVKEENHEVHFSKAEDEFLKTPLHDTGSIWYKVLSFFFPIIGIIAAMVYKKKQYYHNYKACKQGALYGFAVLAVILLIFIIALILVVL